jgi:hypothetical protein
LPLTHIYRFLILPRVHIKKIRYDEGMPVKPGLGQSTYKADIMLLARAERMAANACASSFYLMAAQQ